MFFRPAPLDARDLRLILAIVDEGGLTRAAERLNVTQSALSHQLKGVETSLGVPLFVRAKKRLMLTEAGEELVNRSRQIVADIEALEDDLRQRAAGWRGTVRLSTECYTCYEWLPPLLKRFNRRHENVDVRIIAEATRQPIRALLEGEIDLGIVTQGDPNVELHPLFEDEMLLITAPDHPLASKEFVRPSDLENERLVLHVSRDESFFFRNFFSRVTRKPSDVVAISLTEAIVSMVKAGLGVSAVARWAVASELSSGRLAGIRLGADGYKRKWMAATRNNGGRPLPKHMSDFIELVAESAIPTRFARAI